MCPDRNPFVLIFFTQKLGDLNFVITNRDGDRVPFQTIVIEPRFRFQKIGNRKIEYHMSNFIMSQFYIHLRCQNFVARGLAQARALDDFLGSSLTERA